MDVKHSTLAALQSSMGQAHVDPEKGRQGDFEHWQRIFEATDRTDAAARPLAGHAANGGDVNVPVARQASGQAGGRPLAAQPAHAAWPGHVVPGSGQMPTQGQPLIRDRVIGGAVVSQQAAASPAASSLAGVPPRSQAQTAQMAQTAGAGKGSPTPDGRPLAQLEAHLSRGTDGRLSVALRCSQPLSTAQALHAVAQALAEQEPGSTSVDQVLLNGQPIYRSASLAAHRFEIDC